MKVTVLKPCGYCSGVERAIKLALETKKNNLNKNVVVLGMLVHNQDTLNMLKNNDITTIFDGVSSLEELARTVKKSVVILTAHGHDKKIEEILKNNGNEIVDATCPFVQNSLKEIREQLKIGKTILYIGVNNHPEALAALSIDKNVVLVDKSNPIIPENLKSVAVISQTTLSDEEVKPIINKIKSIYGNAFIIEGICHASSERQNALKTINEEFDAILVVGGENSNNSKTLFNLAKTLYPNKVIKLIQNASQIKEKDLSGLNHIVISSGASTPKEIIEEIKAKLLD